MDKYFTFLHFILLLVACATNSYQSEIHFVKINEKRTILIVSVKCMCTEIYIIKCPRTISACNFIDNITMSPFAIDSNLNNIPLLRFCNSIFSISDSIQTYLIVSLFCYIVTKSTYNCPSG